MRYGRLIFIALFVGMISSTAFAQESATGSASDSMINSPLYGKISSISITMGTGWTSAEILGESGATVLTGVTELRGWRSVPPVPSNATGTGIFFVDTDNNTMKYNITFAGLTSSETSAHIHGPAGPTANSGILFPLQLGSTKTGVINYSQAQEIDLLAGNTYLNIHSSTYPNGEIRGQIYFPSRFGLNGTGTESILSELATRLGANKEAIRPIVVFPTSLINSSTGTTSGTGTTGASISGTGTTGTGANIAGTGTLGTGAIFTGSGIESLRAKGELLRKNYIGVFTAFGQKLDNISNERKEAVFNKLITQVDAKTEQIKKVDQALETKQKFLLLYGDLRLMIQKKLTDIGVKVNTMKSRDNILSDISSVK